MNWKQLKALLRLRFQLTRNQIRKGGSLNSIIFTIAFVCVLLIAISSFFSTAIGGVFFFRTCSPETINLIWNVVTLVFLGASMFEFVNRVQQNDVIELDRLLHLPVTFQGAFILNYLSSLASFNMLMIAPCMLGMAIAMPFALGWPTLVTVPLVVSFIFMITAMMYQFRGWFAGLMKNKRTKGWLMILLPFAVVGLILGIANVMDSKSIRDAVTSQPIGPVSVGIDSANQYGSVLWGILGTLGMTAVGSTGLYFAYRTSIRKYTGADVVANKRDSNNDVDWNQSRQFNKLPGTSIHASSVAMSGMKSLRRAPEAFAAIIPILAALFLGGPYLIGMDGYNIHPAIQEWLPIGIIFLTLIGFPAFLFSTYSYDRDGFRAFVLSPIPRKEILHGKNLAIGIPTVVCGWLSLLVLQIFVPQNVLWLLGSMIQIPATFLSLCFLGHAVSIFAPIGFKRGSMQPVNVKVIPAIAVYVGVLVGPGIATLVTLIAFGPAWLGETLYGYQLGWLYVLLSIVQLIVMSLIYRVSLEPIASWLWKRETDILEVVANIPE